MNEKLLFMNEKYWVYLDSNNYIKRKRHCVLRYCKTNNVETADAIRQLDDGELHYVENDCKIKVVERLYLLINDYIT